LKNNEDLRLFNENPYAKKQQAYIDELKIEVEKLRDIKRFYGECPKWHLEGFKNKDAYDLFLKKQAKKELYEKLKKNFKMKSNKQVNTELCFVFTTDFKGKNNGFKHFSRSINKTICRITGLHEYSRHSNLCVKTLEGVVIECRGNIESNECGIHL